jgi:hypothetical protein
MDIMEKDIQGIWRDIYKPDKFKNSKPTDLFDFEYMTLPHKLYEEKKFMEEVMVLKDRFTVGKENTVFPKADSRNIPIDGLAFFVEKTWDVIRNQKELNLPGQKEMVATYRCNEIKEECLKEVDEDVKNLKRVCEAQLVQNFADQCHTIVDMTMSKYDETAKQYH